MSVARFAFSAAAGGVAVGCSGGGALAATVLRPAQPDEMSSTIKHAQEIAMNFVEFLGKPFTMGTESRGRFLLLRWSFCRAARFQPTRRFGKFF